MRCGAKTRHAWSFASGKRIGPLCGQWALRGKKRCKLHGGRSAHFKPSMGYAVVRRKAAAANVERCKALGIKREGGRRRGGAWISDRMIETAAALARELGVFGLPSRDRRLVWLLCKAAKRPEWRSRAQAALLEAERETARAIIWEMRGKPMPPKPSKKSVVAKRKARGPNGRFVAKSSST